MQPGLHRAKVNILCPDAWTWRIFGFELDRSLHSLHHSRQISIVPPSPKGTVVWLAHVCRQPKTLSSCRMAFYQSLRAVVQVCCAASCWQRNDRSTALKRSGSSIMSHVIPSDCKERRISVLNRNLPCNLRFSLAPRSGREPVICLANQARRPTIRGGVVGRRGRRCHGG